MVWASFLTHLINKVDIIFISNNYLITFINQFSAGYTQSAITCSKLTIETLEQGVKYVQTA